MADSNEYSGFLSDYSKLHKAESPTGQTVLRWADPALKSANYQNVYFEPIVFHPTPKPSEKISQQTLDSVLSFTNQRVKTALGQRLHLVDNKLAPNTLIFRGAITGVSASTQGLHFYEVIPVALVLAGTMAATGERDEDTVLMFEGELIDAKTGKTVFEVVRKGFGKPLSNDRQKVTVEDLQKIVSDMATDIVRYQD